MDYLKELLSKRNIINVLILAILVLAIPLTINLVKQQQILFSKAATDTVQLVDNSCTITQNNKKVLICPTLTLNFVAPSEVDVVTTQRLIKTAYAQASCIYSQQFSGDPNFSDGVHCFTGTCTSALCDFNVNCQYDPVSSKEVACPGSSGSAKVCAANAFDPNQCATCNSQGTGYYTNAGQDFGPKENTTQWCSCAQRYAGASFNSDPQYNICRSGGSTPPPAPSPTPAPARVCTANEFDAQNCRRCAADGSFWGVSGSDYGTNYSSAEWCSCARRYAQDYQTNANYTSCRNSNPTATLTGSQSVTKQNNQWPALTFTVTADSSTQWGLYYQNSSTCTVSSCNLQGWTLIGNISSGNGSITWSSSNLQDVAVGTHTFAVINNPPTKVLATFDVVFNSTPVPTAPPAPTITKVRFAQRQADLTNPNIRGEISYRLGGVKQDITLLDISVGTKAIYTQFVDDKGNTVDGHPSPFLIDLVGPTPNVSSFACEVNIASSTSPNSPSSDLIFTFQGTNFGSQPSAINLTNGGNINIDSWSNTKVVGRLTNLSVSQTAVGARYNATLTTKDNQKSVEQSCLVGITQISLGAQLFCRTQRNFDQDNVELTLILDKDRSQKSTEKVTIDKDGNITDIKTKLRVGDNYIVCIKAPLSLRRCSAPFTASSGTNNITINLPIGDYNGDGNINNVDGSLLKGQWGPVNSNKNCDVNRDGFCNAFEWSCMLHDFNSTNQQIP